MDKENQELRRSEAGDKLVNKYFRVLDDGFIALKDYMGTDFAIEQAARVSYGKGTRKVSDTRNLIRFLMRNKHTTPTEMLELKFHIRIPMDAWRQMIRHRTASVNEYSTRYSEAIDSQQKTDPTEWRLQAKSNKQGSDGTVTKHPENAIPHLEVVISAGDYLTNREHEYHNIARELYEERLEYGVAKEQARKDLLLSTYTEAYWKIDLKNLLGFLSLRCDSHAQLEIRSYANIMAAMIKEVCPLTFEAWYDYAFQSVNFTRLDKVLLHKLFHYPIPYWGNTVYKSETEQVAEEIGMGKRELTEFWDKISVPKEQIFDLSTYEVIDME